MGYAAPSVTMATPADAPIRVAPAAIISAASSAERMPPDAFTPSAFLPRTIENAPVASGAERHPQEQPTVVG